jgi:hypothetical protein
MKSLVSTSKIENFRNLKDSQPKEIIKPFNSERSEREGLSTKKISPHIIKPGKQNQNKTKNSKNRQKLENEEKNASIVIERENVPRQTKFHPMVQNSILNRVANPLYLKLNKPTNYENLSKVQNDSPMRHLKNYDLVNQNKFNEFSKEEDFLNDSFHSKGSNKVKVEEAQFHAFNIPKNIIMDTLRKGNYKTEETKVNNNHLVSGTGKFQNKLATHIDQYGNIVRENNFRKNYRHKEPSVIYELDNLSINEGNSYEINTKPDHIMTIDLGDEEENRYEIYPQANKKISDYIIHDIEERKKNLARSRSRSPRETSLFSYNSSQELLKGLNIKEEGKINFKVRIKRRINYGIP